MWVKRGKNTFREIKREEKGLQMGNNSWFLSPVQLVSISEMASSRELLWLLFLTGLFNFYKGTLLAYENVKVFCIYSSFYKQTIAIHYQVADFRKFLNSYQKSTHTHTHIMFTAVATTSRLVTLKKMKKFRKNFGALFPSFFPPSLHHNICNSLIFIFEQNIFGRVTSSAMIWYEWVFLTKTKEDGV